MKQSAGILVFRRINGGVEALLVHPGGPLWGKKDTWSIPKGELDEDEDHLSAARREFIEEVGMPAPDGELIDLGSYKSSAKVNYIWAVEGSVDLSKFHCEPFTMEWPPHSGTMQEFPENDKAAWFELSLAKRKVFKSQAVVFERLAEKLGLEMLPPPPEAEADQQSLL